MACLISGIICSIFDLKRVSTSSSNSKLTSCSSYGSNFKVKELVGLIEDFYKAAKIPLSYVSLTV
jgi:hypothetical protein